VNTLKALRQVLVFSALLAMLVTFPTVVQSRAPTPAQVEKVLTQICGNTITSECLEAFLKEKGEDARATLSDYELARNILGDDFIPPADVTRARGLVYSRTQLAAFRKTLPSRKVLAQLRADGYVLVAGPPAPFSLSDVHGLNNTLFFFKHIEWYGKYSTDTVGPVWLALRKSVVPNSKNKTWNKQQALLSSDERVPNATEVVWGLTTYRKVHGVYLINEPWVRTSSLDPSGRHIILGNFDSNGMFIHYLQGNHRSYRVGISSARNL